MRDTDLYRQILGLEEPWFVKSVDLDVEAGRVDVRVEHREGVRWRCPKCDKELGCRDHAEERAWRHLDTCQFKTFLHARVPRVDCPEHGVIQARVSWAEQKSRFTMLMERLIIDVAHESATVSGTCRLLDLSWDEVWGVMERSVARGQSRRKEDLIRVAGVDEKAFRKGHDYVTIVCNGEKGTVEYVGDGRRTESLAGFFDGLTEAQKAGLEAVVIDMWEPYVKAIVEGLPDGRRKIVFDKFHVMKLVNEAVDRVRRQENRALVAEGNGILKGTKYLWLYAKENLPRRYRATLKALKETTLMVGRAWAMKEALRSLWKYKTRGWAMRFFRWWFSWARRSRLEPMKKVAKTLENHIENIVSYCRLQATNGVAEGLNSKIMAIKRRACGYRNPDNFKTAIYFFCGGLDLYPR